MAAAMLAESDFVPPQPEHAKLCVWPFLLSPTKAEVRPPEFKATIEPLPGENLTGPCRFELSIPSPTKQVRAVWITYDRGSNTTSAWPALRRRSC
jgi:hypothetical protein